jgi:hypothetical protein
MLELDLRNAGDEDYKGQKNNDFDNLMHNAIRMSTAQPVHLNLSVDEAVMHAPRVLVVKRPLLVAIG